MYNLTTNQFYGGLNRRFDKRTKRLVSMGFSYKSDERGAFFVKNTRKRNNTIAASTVSCAPNRLFWDTVYSIVR